MKYKKRIARRDARIKAWESAASKGSRIDEKNYVIGGKNQGGHYQRKPGSLNR